MDTVFTESVFQEELYCLQSFVDTLSLSISAIPTVIELECDGETHLLRKENLAPKLSDVLKQLLTVLVYMQLLELSIPKAETLHQAAETRLKNGCSLGFSLA